MLDGEPSHRVVDTGALLKGVLREGSLLEGTGPSVATELGALLPTVNDDARVGASATVIVSQRWPALTVHVSAEAAYTRERRLALLSASIVEGPESWTVRPAAELFVERVFDTELTTSALVGAIWRIDGELALDAGARLARQDGDTVFEARAGLTWAAEPWGST